MMTAYNLAINQLRNQDFITANEVVVMLAILGSIYITR